ncbi:primase associated factor [Elephant endotheliotropic herpesvirus 5B]|uniref:Helicase-primase subunit n=1 Tax=Elephant endotheliotropic herpesvirus 5 TaxID=768738 RepID=A0A075CYH9_9BETA|nr:helicase-primase subunit [Elephant endotheliotropic herpesvirus 5]AHC02865.1 helicase-primase subunit [Elephant endotheliotropic herpesvirus 5]UVZ35279.1 primase associated factor [Elephant endotheliotropic herpesvirus 5B]
MDCGQRGRFTAVHGMSCNITLYNVMEINCIPRPLFQVTYLVTNRKDLSSSIQTFFIVGDQINNMICQSLRLEESCDKNVHLKRVAVTSLLYENQISHVLMRLFHPSEIVFNENYEIVFATPIISEDGYEYDLLHMRSMSRMAAVGTYVEPSRPATPPGTCRGTWKVRHGIHTDRDSLMVSIVIENQKYIYSESNTRSKKAKLEAPFIIEPHTIKGVPILRIIPRTILIWFHETQCTVLLRDGIKMLYEKLFWGLKRRLLLPLCTYMGPDIVTGGGPKEICFVGFPFVATACAQTRESPIPCNVCFIDTIRCHGGLSPALGNVQVCYAVKKYANSSSRDEQTMPFNLYLSEEGLKVNEATVNDDMLLPVDVRYAYVKYGALICAKFKHVNFGTLCRLIGEADLPIKCCHFRDKDNQIVKFINRQINDNFQLYIDFFKNRSLVFTLLKQKLNQNSKCRWLVSDNCTNMFVASDKNDWQEVAKFIEDSFRECWFTVMQCKKYVSVLTEAFVGQNYVMIVRDQVISSIGTHSARHTWLADVELLIVNLLRDVRNNPVNCMDTLRAYMRCCVVTMIQNRHILPYWTFDMPPNKFKVVCEGTFDCTPYTGIYGKNSDIIIQYLPSLSDNIDFLQYFSRAADIMKLAINECLRAEVNMESVDVVCTDMLQELKSEIVSQYGHLFFFN